MDVLTSTSERYSTYFPLGIATLVTVLSSDALARKPISQPSLCRTTQECFNEGTTRYGQGHYTEALQFFEASRQRSDTIPSILEKTCIQTALLYNFGLAYEGNGQPQQARELFGKYIEGIDQLRVKVADLHQRAIKYRKESQQKGIKPTKAQELKRTSRYYRKEHQRYKERLAKLGQDYDVVKFRIENSYLEDWDDGARWRAEGDNKHALEEYLEALASPHRTQRATIALYRDIGRIYATLQEDKKAITFLEQYLTAAGTLAQDRDEVLVMISALRQRSGIAETTKPSTTAKHSRRSRKK